jgi:hypothetical protein
MLHPQWREVASFPKHFHAGDQETIIESDLTTEPQQALQEFLAFAQSKITAGGQQNTVLARHV